MSDIKTAQPSGRILFDFWCVYFFIIFCWVSPRLCVAFISTGTPHRRIELVFVFFFLRKKGNNFDSHMKMKSKNCPFRLIFCCWCFVVVVGFCPCLCVFIVNTASVGRDDRNESIDTQIHSVEIYLQTSGRKHLMSETCQHNENEFNIMDFRQFREWDGLAGGGIFLFSFVPFGNMCVCVCAVECVYGIRINI